MFSAPRYKHMIKFRFHNIQKIINMLKKVEALWRTSIFSLNDGITRMVQSRQQIKICQKNV